MTPDINTLYCEITCLIVEVCRDINRNCHQWRLESWFKDFCEGEQRYKKDFGEQTLMEACKESCGGCRQGHGMSG